MKKHRQIFSNLNFTQAKHNPERAYITMGMYRLHKQQTPQVPSKRPRKPEHASIDSALNIVGTSCQTDRQVRKKIKASLSPKDTLVSDLAYGFQESLRLQKYGMTCKPKRICRILKRKRIFVHSGSDFFIKRSRNGKINPNLNTKLLICPYSWRNIFSFLDAPSLTLCRTLSWAHCYNASDDRVWKPLCIKYHKNLLDKLACFSMQSPDLSRSMDIERKNDTHLKVMLMEMHTRDSWMAKYKFALSLIRMHHKSISGESIKENIINQNLFLPDY